MRASFQIARIRGIPIRVHLSLLAILPVLAFFFGQAFRQAARLADVPPEMLGGSPWLWGLGIAVSLFVAILVHELAHSLYALHRGGQVRDITLLFIGGISQISKPPKGSGVEAMMAFVGPLASLVIGAGFYALHAATDGLDSFNLRFAFFYLGYLNLFLGLFNLLPAFPMDGGRILRAALTKPLGRVRATRAAAAFGKALAVVLGVLGLFAFNFFAVIIAAFIFMGAEAESQDVVAHDVLDRVQVAELMAPRTAVVDANATIASALERMASAHRLSLPVRDAGAISGFVTIGDLERLSTEQRRTGSVRLAMRPARTVAPGDPVGAAMDAMGESGLAEVVVARDGELLGTLDQEDINRGLRLRALAAHDREAGWTVAGRSTAMREAQDGSRA